jgi:hypothetical protein
MNKLKLNTFVFTILILLLVNVVFAANFDSNIEVINKDIYPDEYAKYNVSITNLNDFEDSYSLHVSRNWFLTLNEQFINVGVNETKTRILNVKPRNLVAPGKSYNIELEIESTKSDFKKTFIIPVYLKSYNTNYGEYVPSLNLYADYDSEIDPRKELKINLRLRNRNALNITTMYINIDGELFEKTIKDSLLPQQEKIIQVPFKLNKSVKPGDYDLNVEVIIKNQTYASLDETYSIISYSDVEINQKKKREFLKTEQEISLENKGNSKTLKVLELEKNFFERLFVSSDLDYEVKTNEQDKAVIAWEFELEPNEKVIINLTSNYRLLLVSAILLALAIYLYYSLRSKIIVKKKANILHSKDANTSKLKIRLFVKNRSSKKLHDIEIIERVSKLTHLLEDKHELGSAKPSKVIKGKRSTIIKWNLDHVEPHEERIITYKLESKLKLVGSVQFPRTIIKYKDDEGKLLRSHSNKPTLELGKNI